MNIQMGDPGNDFIKEIKPHDRQNDFLSIPDSVFEALYGGAAYGGKSFLLTLYPLIRGFYKFRGFKGILLRRNFPDLEREVIRLSHEYYPLTGAKYNQTKHSWHWEEYGTYLDFGHIQHMADVKRQYDTAQYNYCAFDELTHFEEQMYIYMVGSRVRPSSGFNIAIARSGTNPGGVGQSFVYNRFVKPCEEGYKILKDKHTGLLRTYIPCLPQDNPYGMSYDPQYLMKLEMLPENEKKAKKYGDWHAFEGSVFPEFRSFRFPGEPENALHVIEPFTVPEWWPRILSIDWGKRAMCHAMWAAISPDNRLYVYRERGWLGKDLPYWASEIRELSRDESIIHCIMCGSAWQDRGLETIAEQFKRYSGIIPTSSQNNPGSRIAGLQLIHDFMRWEQKTLLRSREEFYDLDKANLIFRLHGMEGLARYKSSFLDEPKQDNLPRIQFFNTCQIVIDTIPVVVHDEKNPEDIKEFVGDDPIDNLNYLCRAANQYMNGMNTELVHLQKINEAVQKLNQTQDQTSFYMQMEKLEEKNKTFGVVRRSALRRRHV